jgi:hypothetical protein
VGRWIVALLLALGLLGAGYYVGWEWGWPALREAQRSEDWPKTLGWVERSRVVSFAPTGGRVEPRLELAYSYVVDGTAYTGHRVRLPLPLELGLGFAETPQQLSARYPAGLEVDVHYDPQDPSQAVLEPGAPPRAYLPIAVGAVLLLSGAGALAGAVLNGMRRVGRSGPGRRRAASSRKSRRR